MTETGIRYFKIETLYPILIGTGQELVITDYVVDQNQVIIFDPVRLMKKLSSQQRVLLDQSFSQDIEAACQFLEKHISQIKASAIIRTVDCSKVFIEKRKQCLRHHGGLKQFNVLATNLNTSTSQPCLPGSSIKGAIRTAMLNSFANAQQHLNEKDSRKLENSLLGGTFSKDPFSLFSVSDFTPTSKVRTKIVPVVRRKKKITGDRRSGNSKDGVSAFCEVIPAGTSFVGSIKIDSAQERGGRQVGRQLSFDQFFRSLCAFYGEELSKEQNELSPPPKALARNLSDAEYPIRIGRFSGAVCMTLDGYRTNNPKEIGCVQEDSRDHTKNPLLGWCAFSEIERAAYEAVVSSAEVSSDKELVQEAEVSNVEQPVYLILGEEVERDKQLAYDSSLAEEVMFELVTRLIGRAHSKKYGKQAVKDIGTGCKEWIVRNAKKDDPKWKKAVDFLRQRLGPF